MIPQEVVTSSGWMDLSDAVIHFIKSVGVPIAVAAGIFWLAIEVVRALKAKWKK